MEHRLAVVACGANTRFSSSPGDIVGLCDTSQASLFLPLSAPELGWGLLRSKHTGRWGQALQPTSSLEENLSPGAGTQLTAGSFLVPGPMLRTRGTMVPKCRPRHCLPGSGVAWA